MRTPTTEKADASQHSRQLKIPVTIMIEQRLIVRKFWSLPAWHLIGVVVGESLAHGERHGEKVRDTETGAVYSWSGYQVTLYKDACERYWHALIGDKPKVYAICRDSDENDVLPIKPLVVTVDYDEAIAYAETDEQVLSMLIPGELYRYMEKFVLEHYRPKAFKKRKRTAWGEDKAGNPDKPDTVAKPGLPGSSGNSKA